jgi:predicted MFS family arabinose efflux permease
LAAPFSYPEKPKWFDAIVLMVCQTSQALLMGGIALFLPLIRHDLGLSFTEAGSLAATSTGIYALMQIPSGFLADRFGPRRLFLVGLAGVNAMAIGFALLDAYWLLLANQAVSGFFRALVFAPGLLLMTHLFPEQRRAMAFGLFVAGGISSNVLLNLIGPVLVDPLGWRAVFVVFALLGFMVMALFWRRSEPDPPRAHDADTASVREGVRVFRHPVMLMLGAIQFIRLGTFLGLATWLPSFLVDQKGYSLEVAGLIIACGAVAGAPANVIGGYVSDRLGRPILVVGASMLILAMSTAALVPVEGIVPILIVVAINGIFAQFYFGALFAIPIEMLGRRTAGLTSGIGNFFANVGAFVFIYVMGALRDSTDSFDLGLYILAAGCVLGVGLSFVLSRMRGMVPPAEAVPRPL